MTDPCASGNHMTAELVPVKHCRRCGRAVSLKTGKTLRKFVKPEDRVKDWPDPPTRANQPTEESNP